MGESNRMGKCWRDRQRPDLVQSFYAIFGVCVIEVPLKPFRDLKKGRNMIQVTF